MSEVLAGEPEASELDLALEQIGTDELAEAFGGVARKLPVAVGVETVAIRIRDSDGDGLLHLVATEGTPPGDRRNPVFYTQSIAQARVLFALKSRHGLAQALGFTWLTGVWMEDGGRPIGTITVGSRTERRPTDTQAALLRNVAERLAPRVRELDRRTSQLESISRQVARASFSAPVDAPARVTGLLRPRELTVLALYSDGLSVPDIADIFVISPHTVRTHVKNAYRRLGIHSREEAARVIRTERILELV